MLVSILPPTGHVPELTFRSQLISDRCGMICTTHKWQHFRIGKFLRHHIFWCVRKARCGIWTILGSTRDDFRWRHINIGYTLTLNCFSNFLSILLRLGRRQHLSGAGRPLHTPTFLPNRASISPLTLYLCYYLLIIYKSLFLNQWI